MNKQTILSQTYENIKELTQSNDYKPFIVTTTFISPANQLIKREKEDFCFRHYNQNYRWVTSRLINNAKRKWHLHPRTFDFIDYPGSRKHKPNEESFPHIHSIWLVKPEIERFSTFAICPSLFFHHKFSANLKEIDVQPITENLEDVVKYAGKYVTWDQEASNWRKIESSNLVSMMPIPQSQWGKRHSRRYKYKPPPSHIMKKASQEELVL